MSAWCLVLVPIPVFLPQECYLDSDQTSLYHAAKGLMTLQALYGTIPQIFGKGECARVSRWQGWHLLHWNSLSA